MRKNIAHVVGCVLLSVWSMPSRQHVRSSQAGAQLWHFSKLLPQRTQSSRFNAKKQEVPFSSGSASSDGRAFVFI